MSKSVTDDLINGRTGWEREECQEPRLMWAGQDSELQQARHLWAYVVGKRESISDKTSPAIGGMFIYNFSRRRGIWDGIR